MLWIIVILGSIIYWIVIGSSKNMAGHPGIESSSQNLFSNSLQMIGLGNPKEKNNWALSMNPRQ